MARGGQVLDLIGTEIVPLEGPAGETTVQAIANLAPGGAGGTDLVAIGTYLTEIPAWGEPGFVDPGTGDDSHGWVALVANASGGDLTVGFGSDGESWTELQTGSDGGLVDLGYGVGGNTSAAHLVARSAHAQLRVVAATGQSDALLDLVAEDGSTRVLRVYQNGTFDPPLPVSFPITSDDSTETASIAAGSSLVTSIANNADGGLFGTLELFPGTTRLSAQTGGAGVLTEILIDSGDVTVTAGTFVWTFANADGSTAFPGPIGVNGVTPPAQAAHPSTLGDVITILVNLGLCAS